MLSFFTLNFYVSNNYKLKAQQMAKNTSITLGENFKNLINQKTFFPLSRKSIYKYAQLLNNIHLCLILGRHTNNKI